LARMVLEEFIRTRLMDANRIIAQRMVEREKEEEDDVDISIRPPKRTILFHDYNEDKPRRIGASRRYEEDPED